MNWSLFLIVFLLISVHAEHDLPNNSLADDEDIEVNKGKDLVISAFKTLIYGEEKSVSYKDLFIDTSKSIFEHLDTGLDISFEIPVDDMLTILVQSIIILIANRRVDLIPVDFSGD